MDAFEQIQENTIAGSAFSARLGSSAVAFIPDPASGILLEILKLFCFSDVIFSEPIHELQKIFEKI